MGLVSDQDLVETRVDRAWHDGFWWGFLFGGFLGTLIAFLR